MPELYCQIGEHHYHRDSQRGRIPNSCPEHRLAKGTQVVSKEKLVLTSEHKEKMQEGKQRKSRTDLEQKIQERIEGKRCRCGIKPDMNDAELRALYPGCCDPLFVCSVLDGVMRAVYTYT
jgi:hypothetical protein